MVATGIGGMSGGFLGFIRESFTGAWQKNVVVDTLPNIFAFSAVYACVSLIADDVAKLRPKLMQQTDWGTWVENLSPSPFWPVLRKPNNYQTRIQFLSSWVTTKLLNGNVYVLKERDQRGIVTALHILDPRRQVLPLVAPDGSVFYQIGIDWLANVENSTTVPASEIIHDRMITPWHPLIGITPIYACGAAATQGIRIQANSAQFFENMSRPSGMLTAPGTIPDATAERLKKHFEENYAGSKIGRLAVLGDGLKYEAMTIPAADAQLIEQLRWTVEDVARCFRVPSHKLGGGNLTHGTAVNMGSLNQDYYMQTLQTHIESIELLLDEGLGMPIGMGVELELEGLLRMDPTARMEVAANGVGSGILKPNEARLRENLPPIEGGDAAYLQQQNFSLAALAKRDAGPDPFSTGKPADAPSSAPADGATPPPKTPPADEASATDAARALTDALITKFAEAEYELT